MGFPWDANLSASLPFCLQGACWKAGGGIAGEGKGKTLGREKEKNDRGAFPFLISSAMSFSFQSLANEIVPVQPQ